MTYQHLIPTGICLALGLFCLLARSWGWEIIDEATGEPVDWEREAACWYGCGIVCLLIALLAALASGGTGFIPQDGVRRPTLALLLHRTYL